MDEGDHRERPLPGVDGQPEAADLLRRVAVPDRVADADLEDPRVGHGRDGLITGPVGATRRDEHGEDEQERTHSCPIGDIAFDRPRCEQRIDLGIIESEFGAHVTGVGTESRCGPDIRNRHAGRMEPWPSKVMPPIGG